MTPLGGSTPRTDLPWLRRRPLAPPPGPAAAPKIDTTHPGRTVRPSAASALSPASPPSAPAALGAGSHPGPSAEPLDLSRPSIDTTHPGRPAATGPTPVADPLDLSGAPAAAAPRPKPAPARPQPRARSGPPTLLGPDTPTVTLTRLQSGVGVLQVDLISTLPALRLGAAYELSDGRTSAIIDGGHADAAPPTRPVLRLTRDRYAGLQVDLRQTRSLRRLAVLAVPEGAVDWTGTLVITTAAGARLEAPLDLGHGQGPAVLLSAYVLDGEIVLRAERELVTGTLRDACLAFGYDRITWADDRTPAS